MAKKKKPRKKAPARRKAGKTRVGKKAAKKSSSTAGKATPRKARDATRRTSRGGKVPARGGKAPARTGARSPSPRTTLQRAAPTRTTRNAAFFEHFRQRLLHERQQISRRLDELREELRGLDETPREMEEWAQEEKDRDILIRLEERETDELRKIQAALTLIDQKEYGRCQVCGKAIPRARLEELPTAFRCVDCTP